MVHGVAVIQLFQAGGALGTVCILEAAVQAVVPHAVAVTVAWLLMQHDRYLGCQFVGVGLIGNCPFSPQSGSLGREGVTVVPFGAGPALLAGADPDPCS